MDDNEKNANNPWQGWWPGYGAGPGYGGPGTPPPPGAPFAGAGPGMPPPYWPGYGHPYHHYYGHPGYPPPPGAAGVGGLLGGLTQGNDAFLKGLLIGAGASLLLSNETVQKTTIATLVKLWAGMQGGVEELKERFRDIEAELQAASDDES